MARHVIDGQVATSTTGRVAADTAYDVVGLCSGTHQVVYRVVAGEQEAGEGSIVCGIRQLNTAVTAGVARDVSIELVEASSAEMLAVLELIASDTPVGD
ncbi:MAG: hypothetical protein Q4G34_04225 [Micrococcus sp.]|nr:hypothetical protein [Micrococcus sp.]